MGPKRLAVVPAVPADPALERLRWGQRTLQQKICFDQEKRKSGNADTGKEGFLRS